MPAVASAATSVVIAHVAAGTSTIRVGAGGIMLPNHSPLVIAEQFGTLESLFPKRIDLGLGRAPGSDQITAMALRRSLSVDYVSAGRPGAHRVFSRASTRTTCQGRTRRRAARAHLDSRLQPVRRDARGRARSALRLRVALRAGADDVGDRDLSHAFPADVDPGGRPRAFAPDARRQHRRRGHRRRGAAALHVTPADLPGAAARHARAGAAATRSRRVRRIADAARTSRVAACPRVGHRRLTGQPCGAASPNSSNGPAPTRSSWPARSSITRRGCGRMRSSRTYPGLGGRGLGLRAEAQNV